VPRISETTPEPVDHANGALPRLSTDALNDLLSKLRALSLSWTVGEVDAIARKLGWPLCSRGETKFAGLDPRWGLNKLEITIPFEGHRLKYIGARLTPFADQTTPEVREQIQDAFAALARSAIRHLGEPTFRLHGTIPQVQWRGDDAILAVLRHPQGVLATLRPNHGQALLNRTWAKGGQVTIFEPPPTLAEVAAPSLSPPFERSPGEPAQIDGPSADGPSAGGPDDGPPSAEAVPPRGGWRMIDRDQAKLLLASLRGLRWDWTPDEIPALARELGWTITRRGDSSTAASAGFGFSQHEVLFSCYRGNKLVELISVDATKTVGRATLESRAFLRAAYAEMRAVGMDLWGQPDHDADELDPDALATGFTAAAECRWVGEDSTLVLQAGDLWLRVQLLPNHRLAVWDRRQASVRGVPEAPPWADADWGQLAAGLAAALPDLRHGDTVILRAGDRYVRLRQEPTALAVDTVGSDALGLAAEPAAAYEDQLFELGWSEPRPPSGRSWSRTALWPPTPADARRAADLAVATLHDTHGVAAPAELTYEAFQLDGKQLNLPALANLRRA
jgi:hypothetical protein